jgi:hypothetical protein
MLAKAVGLGMTKEYCDHSQPAKTASVPSEIRVECSRINPVACTPSSLVVIVGRTAVHADGFLAVQS